MTNSTNVEGAADAASLSVVSHLRNVSALPGQVVVVQTDPALVHQALSPHRVPNPTDPLFLAHTWPGVSSPYFSRASARLLASRHRSGSPSSISSCRLLRNFAV